MESVTELPKKVYRISLILRIVSIIAVLILITMICWVIQLTFSEPLSLPKSLRGMLPIGVAILGLFSSLFYWNDRIEISDEGIVYYGFGFRMYTPWENIAGVVRRKHLHAFLFRHPLNTLVLKTPALLNKSINEGKQRKVAVIERLWPAFLAKPPTYNLYLPLIPGNLMNADLSQHEISLYLSRYAPWVLAEFVQRV